jgi:hypothetical protein
MAVRGSESVNRRARVCDDNAHMPDFKPSFSLRSPVASVGASQRRWGLGVATLLVWLGVGLSVGAWALHWWGRAPLVELPAQAVAVVTLDPQQVLTAVRGSQGPALVDSPVAAEWQLLGVVSTPDGRGAALLSRNGERARPVAVGQPLPDGGLVLQGIRGREVLLGPQAQGPTTQTLRLPTPAPTASLAPSASAAAPAQ